MRDGFEVPAKNQDSAGGVAEFVEGGHFAVFRTDGVQDDRRQARDAD